MKKSLLFILGLIFTGFAVNVWATAKITRDSNNKFNFVKMSALGYSTMFQYTDTGAIVYTGQGYRAGSQWGRMVMMSSLQDVPSNYVAPRSASLDYALVDMYKDTLGHANVDISDFMGTLGTSDDQYVSSQEFLDIPRGGKYAATIYSDTLGYEYRDTIDILDDPSLRINCFSVKVGKDIDVTAKFNTGYPYDVDSYTDNETTRDTLYFVKNDSTLEKIYASQKKLSLKNADKPLIANIDTVSFKVSKPHVGRYKLVFNSDFAYGNKTFYIDVNDTLRAKATLNKSSYVLGTDKKATIHLTMDYGYPHILSTKAYPAPTIIIADKLLQREDTMYVTNDSLSGKDLSYSTDIDIPIDTISAASLATYGDTLKIRLSVSFNDAQQFETSLPLVFENATGIQDVNSDESVARRGIYLINGMKCNKKEDELSPGLYIIDGKKVLK